MDKLKAIIEVSNIKGNTNFRVICESLIIDGFTSYSEAKNYCLQCNYEIVNETNPRNLMNQFFESLKIPKESMEYKDYKDTYTVQFNTTNLLQEILKDTSKLKRKINW